MNDHYSGSGQRQLEVLVVASHRDYEITAQCLRNVAAYLPGRSRTFLATDCPREGKRLVSRVGVGDVTVVGDDEVLSRREREFPGWYRQQVIKLRADRILSGENFCVVSGDTLLARTLLNTDLIAPCGLPYLYVNRYRYSSTHLAYERRRVRAVAQLLGVTPTASLHLGDFISDLFCFSRAILALSITRLQHLHGKEWTRVLEGRNTSPKDQERFGEYTLYAVTALELSPSPPPVRVCHETHVLQLHSRRSLYRARFEAPIVHLVDKRISVEEVAAHGLRYGRQLRPGEVALPQGSGGLT